MTRIVPLTWWSAGINLAGALAVGYGIARVASGVTGWVLALAVLALAAWIGRTLVAAGLGPRAAQAGRGARALVAAMLGVMVVAGGVTAVPTQGVGVAMLLVAVLVTVSDPHTPLLHCGIAILAGALAVAVGALAAATGVAGAAGRLMDVSGLLGVLAGLLLAVFAGFGRRAQRVLQNERERAAEEAVRAQATADRVAVARELHDVLAHSLGGLVVQLDAAEALLDHGDAATAVVRVAAARRLAAEGLREAREAVRTLREPVVHDPATPGATVHPDELNARIDALCASHRSLGARVERGGDGVPRRIPAPLGDALVRAVQEGLSNARKHALGAPVRIRLLWQADRVQVVVENPLVVARSASELAGTGGGFGVAGVRERFAALGGSAEAGPSEDTTGGGSFVLRAEAPA
ncbi:sensor histidine kinase [uncultured Microbacterium sp.]|uniref:sensor histidine kinase n=1 Tax=uncultured Microbacterium sp. TaxID=191216 RepID=UPI0025F00F80|nr:histidine kinase [uncultured Microbacterium sp.]